MKSSGFNTNMDRLASACPQCEMAKRKQYLLSARELEKYTEHLRVMHGMSQ